MGGSGADGGQGNARLRTPDTDVQQNGREAPTNDNLSFPLVRRRKLQSLEMLCAPFLKGILAGQTRRH